MDTDLNIPKLQTLQTMNDGAFFSALATVNKVETRTTSSTFIIFGFSDQSFSVTCTIFQNSRVYRDIESLKPGDIVQMSGTQAHYNDSIAPKITAAVKVKPDELSKEQQSQLVKKSKYDPEIMLTELMKILEDVQNPTLKAVVTELVQKEENFIYATCAMKNHHAHRSGLLEHTLSMLKIAKMLVAHYSKVNSDIVLAAIICHDLGKMKEYTQELVPQYAEIGNLYGHLYIGAKTFENTAERMGLNPEITKHIAHCILSHHKNPEWGAIVRPSTIEATLVAYIDGLDCVMGIIDTAYDENPDMTKTPYIPTLQASLIRYQGEQNNVN
jgi:3'-5' exoribonuclease